MKRTYDILNAGPRNRFMANGKIVSNSSRGAQLQNLPRGGTIKEIIGALDAILVGITLDELKDIYGAPLVIASELLRPTFTVPEEYWMARGDYSQIEARVNPWLAGETAVVEAFVAYDAGTGPDAYLVSAGQIYGVDPNTISKDDPRRQVGKTVVLACGFGGGAKALKAMAKLLNVKVDDETAVQVVKAWREANSKIKAFWKNLENAAKQCVNGPLGQKHVVRQGLWFVRNKRTLVMRLPSGSSLCYWYPRVENVVAPWKDADGGEVTIESVTFWAEDAQTKRWQKQHSYGGLWCENAVQSIARDVMTDALLRLDAAGLAPVLTVHDEAVCQIPKSRYPAKAAAAEAVRSIMAQAPPWAVGLPIAVDASADSRYLKG